MTLHEALDWMRSLRECIPGLKSRRLTEVMGAFARESPGLRWEFGLSAEDTFSGLHLRVFGDEEYFEGFRELARRRWPQWGGGAKTPPPPQFPWLDFHWDLKRDSLRGARLYAGSGPFRLRPGQAFGFEPGGRDILLSPRPFSGQFFEGTALAGALQSLFKVRDIITEWEIAPGGRPKARESWAVRFREAIPWPRYARSDMADPFLPSAARLALLMLNRRVTEAVYRAGAVRAYFRA